MLVHSHFRLGALNLLLAGALMAGTDKAPTEPVVTPEPRISL